MSKNKAQVIMLAADLKQAKCEAARLVEAQALLDSQLVAMDEQFFLERRNEYPSETERAAYVAREQRSDPTYSSLYRKSLALERQLAEAEAKRQELAVLLALEMDGIRDWSESPDLCEDCGLYRSEIRAVLSASAEAPKVDNSCQTKDPECGPEMS